MAGRSLRKSPARSEPHLARSVRGFIIISVARSNVETTKGNGCTARGAKAMTDEALTCESCGQPLERSMRDAVEADLGLLPEDLRRSALAALARRQAAVLDSPDTGHTAVSQASRTLLDTLVKLAERAPKQGGRESDVDRIRRGRASRRAAAENL
jgi:predicted transcriptional regulator of viral defense system